MTERKQLVGQIRRQGHKETMLKSFVALGWLLLLCNAAVRAAKIQTFHLHPTSELASKQESPNDFRRLAESWLHPALNSIYATLPKEGNDSDDPSDADVKDFHAHRHLSRYERHYRQTYDIQEPFDGVYVDSNYTVSRNLQAHEDPYHVTPLNQGYGTHYVNLWVGSPTPQRKTVIVDTGSHYTAFPCTGCRSCGESHHTDPYFNPASSETFRPLQCHECIRGATCHDGKCAFSQSYTEGSSWDAYLAEDTLFCGGNDILDAADPMNSQFAIPFMFGCQTTETGLFVTQLADGIMGMSAHESTLPKKLYDLGKIDHNMFAMCFNRQLGTSKRGVTAGVMTMGGVDVRIHSSPMVYAKNMATVGWYTVFVRNVYIQNADESLSHEERITRIPIDISAINSGKGVIVDSGTTDTYLHKKLAKSFGKIWKQVTGNDYHHRPISLTEEQLNRLPTVIVQCAGAYVPPGEFSYNDTELLAGKLDPSAPNDVLISIPPTSYMEYSPVAKLYTSRIYFTESQGGVLGANAMIGHNVLFDWEHGRVGFARSTCEHPDENHEEVDEPESSNCALSDETLTHTCEESLNVEQCGNSPNRVLRGVETWSMLVADQGTDDGVSCERAALMKAANKGRDRSTITCDNDGTCTEQRPCEMKCSDITKTTTTNLKAVAKITPSKSKVCSDAWSACDSSCTQTRVISELLEDGVCHEKERLKRHCHTGACIKSHPCHVPFVVRAEIGLPNKTSLSPKTELKVADAFIAAIEKETYGHILGHGDIRVLSTSSWVNDNALVAGTDTVSGVKAVIEISIVNTNISPDNDENSVDSGRLSALAKGFRRSVQRRQPPQCKDSEMFRLAKFSLNIKEILLSSPVLLNELDTLLGIEASRILSAKVSSSVKKDDAVVPLGSFSAGFHTHRLRQYAHHNPFMAVLFFLSVSFLVFGTCSAFEWALTVAVKKVPFFSNTKESSSDTVQVRDCSHHSSGEDSILMEQLVPPAAVTPEDNVSLGSDDHDHDDMLERFFHRATGTPPRKIKEDADTPLRIPSFEQTHSLDESMDRSVSRGASPRKRKVERNEVETDLELARQKLERHV